MRRDVVAHVEATLGPDAVVLRGPPDAADQREPVDAVLLLDEELSAAGDHAESMLDAAVRAVRAGGWLALTLANAELPATRSSSVRAWRPEDVERLLGGRGVVLDGLWGVGATSRLAGAPPRLDPIGDRRPSIVGAGDPLLAIGRTPVSSAQRSQVFLATLPRKTVAAATVTRRDDGRMLVVRDVYKRRWTIPGGVVDADEDPRAGAVRETYEESGITVRVEQLGGVFHSRWPDRLVLVFLARPLGSLQPRPLHPHEVDDAAWLPVEEAIATVATSTAAQIRRSLSTPGRVWSDEEA